MKKLFCLVRVALRVNFGLSVLRPRELLKKKKDLWMAPLIGLGLVGLAPVLIYYLKGLRWVYNLLAPMGQQAAVLTFGLLAGQFLILVFGFYYVISSFYFSRDLALLVPLPVTPTQVLLSKFTVILVNEYVTAAPLVLPVLIQYGLLAKAGPRYWIEAVLVYLLLPVIPLSIVALLAVGLMRAVNVGRKKDFLIVAGSLVLMTAALGGQYWLSRSMGASVSSEAIIRLFASPDGFVQSIGARFPPSVWATRALAFGLDAPGPAGAALYLGLSLGLFAGIMAFSRRVFYRGLIGLSERGTRGKSLGRGALERKLRGGRRPVRAVFIRELRIMNRTPIFLLNGVLSAVLIPIVFIVMGKTGGGTGSDSAQLIGLLASARPETAVLGTALFMTVCACLNGTASSSFSREGAQFWMSKIIPVAPRDQVKGKILHSLGIAGLGLAAAAAAAAFVFGIKPLHLAGALALALPATFVLTVVSLMIDLARPLLVWTNPQKAIKQNLNVLLAFFADAGILFLGFWLVKALASTGMGTTLLLGAVLAVFAALGAAGYVLLGAFAERRYRAIET
jgi:ABC-2 type transport system permease protein